MSDKALLVIDIPKTCEKCPFCDFGDYTCGAFQMIGEKYTYDVPEYGFPIPDWCPLKPMPEKHQVVLDSLDSFGTGWNACIDKILEGCKNEND